MRYNPTTRPAQLAPVFGLALAAAISACAPGGSSSTQNPQNAQGSFSAAPTQVHPTAQSAPAVPPSANVSASAVASGSGGPAGAATKITATWNAFFGSATPSSERVQLLQNGAEFATAITAFAASPLAGAVTTKVMSVRLTSAARATVTYDLGAGGQPVASGASGTAVLQDGRWKVGDDVFCGLLRKAKSAGTSIPVPAACGSAG